MHPDEEAFWAKLRLHPDDHTTRLVFADWLEERGYTRGEGMRALGANRLWVLERPYHSWWFVADPEVGNYAGAGMDNQKERQPHNTLPADWFRAVVEDRIKNCYRSFNDRSPCTGSGATAREMENVAAETFSRLPPERRAELLSAAMC